jgi:hypothetical protein
LTGSSAPLALAWSDCLRIATDNKWQQCSFIMSTLRILADGTHQRRRQIRPE